jgi:ParB-like nuclease domain
MSAKQSGTIVESGTEIFIPLNKLKKSPKNARKTPHSEAAIEAYAASIAAKGILQNLVVEPELDGDGAATGFYFVTIGEGRRLTQLLRVKRREINKTEPIRCIVDTANDPHEISLDENVTWENMHPADQFEAFKKLAEERGLGAEDIAARFGVTPQLVQQRLRLGAVSPKLMQAYRDGELAQPAWEFPVQPIARMGGNRQRCRTPDDRLKRVIYTVRISHRTAAHRVQAGRAGLTDTFASGRNSPFMKAGCGKTDHLAAASARLARAWR